MNFYKILSIILIAFCSNSYADKKINIVTSSSPLASIFYMITAEDKITYLATNYGCPHDYKMQPSQLKLIKNADVITYIDEAFDGFIVKATMGNEKAHILRFSNLKLFLIKDKADIVNWHIWLNTDNVRLMLLEILDVVSRLRPAKKDYYLKNYEKAIHLLDLLDKRAATLDAEKSLLLADNLEYLFVKFQNSPIKILLGNKQPTIEYAKVLRTKADSGNFYCSIINNHQPAEHYDKMMNNKLKIVILNPENWLIKDSEEPELAYYNNMQTMFNLFSHTCSGAGIK